MVMINQLRLTKSYDRLTKSYDRLTKSYDSEASKVL